MSEKVNTPQFNGSDYDAVFDQSRLSGQIQRVHECMKDGVWRTLDEIAKQTTAMKKAAAKDGVEVSEDGASSISAQLRNLRKQRFGSYTVDKRSRGDREKGLYEYRLTSQSKLSAPTELEKHDDDSRRAEIYAKRHIQNVKKAEENKQKAGEGVGVSEEVKSEVEGDKYVIISRTATEQMEEVAPVINKNQLSLF